MIDPFVREKAKIALLLGAGLIGAFILQSIAFWRADSTGAAIIPERVTGTVKSVSLLPSKVRLKYAVVVDVNDVERTTLIAPLDLAEKCQIGEVIELEQRGLNYRFAGTGCGND